MKPEGFQMTVRNDFWHGQLTIVRLSIKNKEMDVSRWSTDNLHLVAVELLEQRICNIINVYGCSFTMKEQERMALDDLHTHLCVGN